MSVNTIQQLTTDYQHDLTPLLAQLTPETALTILTSIRALTGSTIEKLKAADALAKSTRDSKNESLPPHEYYVHRRLAGAIIGPYYYNEAIVRTGGWQDNDIVRLDKNLQHPDHLPYVKIIKAATEPTNRIHRFTYGYIEKDKYGNLFIDHNAWGQRIMINGVAKIYELKPRDLTYRTLMPGDLVDIAWYANEQREDSDAAFVEARVTWFHDKNELSQSHIARSTSHKILKAQREEAAAKPKYQYQPKLDFNLDNKTVLLIGYPERQSEIAEIIKAHHGQMLDYDVKNDPHGDNPTFDRYVRTSDLVIVLGNNTSHFASNTANTLAKNYGKPLALASQSSPLIIEQAIYRALNGLPAFVTSNSTIAYPAKPSTKEGEQA